MSNDTPKCEEEEKGSTTFSQFARYSIPVCDHVNPLLHNKGSVGVSKDVAKKDPPVSLVVPGRKKVFHRGDTKESVESDGPGMSEFESFEGGSQIGTLLQLPLFEIHNTMELLLQKRQLQVGDTDPPAESSSSSNSPNKEKKIDGGGSYACRMPLKSYSMQPPENPCNMEALATELPPAQFEFLKQMYAFKTNYLFHVLNMRDIYFQYVAVSKGIANLANSQNIEDQMKMMQTHAKNFTRDLCVHTRGISFLLNMRYR